MITINCSLTAAEFLYKGFKKGDMQDVLHRLLERFINGMLWLHFSALFSQTPALRHDSLAAC